MADKIAYDLDAEHDWALFVADSPADPKLPVAPDACLGGNPEDEGGVVGTSEWIWLEKENARRLVASWNLCRSLPLAALEALAEGEPL